MSLQFTVQIEPKVVRQATRGIFWHQATRPLIWAGLGSLLLLSQLLLWAVLPQLPWSLHGLLGLLFLGSLLGLSFLLARHYEDQALRNFVRFKDVPVFVSLEPDAYRYRAEWGEGAIPWNAFDSLWRFAGVWVLLQHRPGGVSVLLPAEKLSEEARIFLLSRVKVWV